jgi:hypothetical protein
LGKASKVEWQNRIVGEGEEAPEKLLANPSNWRVHSHEQENALAAVLDKVGWVTRIIVNRKTGHVVDGHLRVAMAISRNEKTVPVLYVDLSEEEENLILATLDPLSAMAGTDNEKLEALLRDIPNMGAEIDALLATIAPPSIVDATAERREQGQNYFTARAKGTGFFSVGAISAPVPLDLLQEAEAHLQERVDAGETLEEVLCDALRAILKC